MIECWSAAVLLKGNDQLDIDISTLRTELLCVCGGGGGGEGGKIGSGVCALGGGGGLRECVYMGG